tara:strand:- start:76 stop:405 length:330 start_codon:yes stop_codon:yes gene_type:complete
MNYKVNKDHSFIKKGGGAGNKVLPDYSKGYGEDKVATDPPPVEGGVKEEVEASGGKAGKSQAQRNYDKNLDKKASELYIRDRSKRTGGTDFSTASDKIKNSYRAKAQNS